MAHILFNNVPLMKLFLDKKKSSIIKYINENNPAMHNINIFELLNKNNTI